MSTLTKEQIKQLVRENNFQSVSDINEYLKDIFKDINTRTFRSRT